MSRIREIPDRYKWCGYCGNVFPSRRRSHKFCSTSCAVRYRRGREPRICAYCSREFESRGHKQMYCSVSCGLVVHGHTANGQRTKPYMAWNNMIQRCYNKKNPSYENYGGRGITVCNEWRHDFQAFYDWAINRSDYAEDKSLDRYPNNDGNYEPNNCRWATNKEQQNNRRGSN